MNALKHRNMMTAYTGFAGPQTMKAILDQIPESLQQRFTGKELGMACNAVNAAWHHAKTICARYQVDDVGIWDNHAQKLTEWGELN